MDTAHESNVARIRAWLAEHGTHDLSVTVLTGANVVPVAAGPFLGLEEHPVSKGVFRALFQDARRVSIIPDEEKSITFGSELQAVETHADRLVLDKGAQRIEIVDLQPVPTSDEVTWESAAPQPMAAASVAAPVIQPTPVAPVLPAQTSAPVSAASGGAVDLTAKAPLYGNAMGTGFFGTVNVRIEQGWMSITGMRGSAGGTMLVGGALLLVLGGLSLIVGLVVAFNAEGDSDMGLAFCFMGVGLLLTLAGLGLYLVGRARATKGVMSTLQFRLMDAKGKKRVSYDSNLGCLLALFATPIVGLVVMLALGRRKVQLVVPEDRDGRRKRQNLVLKTLSTADGSVLDSALRG